MVREDMLSRVHPDDLKLVSAAIARTLEEDAKYYVEFRVVWQDGSIHWLNSRAEVERDQNGQDVRMFGGAINVTRHKLEKTLKNEFISNVSHELRTPLTSIYGSLGLLLGDVYGELPGDVKSLINVAHRNSDRLVRLINDILNIQKMEAGKLHFNFQRHDIVEMVSQAIETNKA